MLTTGQTIGSYEILGVIGQGGMGHVYRARDRKLNRDVALKVLPDLFATDSDRLARFTREAQALAALNHPNIAQVYGFEEASGIRALVMELVEGDDLSLHIARGPIAPADAVPLARQIADALESAHEQGIIHRDLKPANIKVRTDGTVKVLDFGLAKALAPEGASTADAQNSPTLTARATQMGVILGTAAYMSPEQAKGKPVDRRADIWAFGVVLYEMLTGRRAFEGEDVSTTLAAVLMKEPEWQSLPAGTPHALETLVRRCLERDARKRLRDIGEARILLSDQAAVAPPTATASAPATTPPSRLPWLLAAGAGVAALVFGFLWLSGTRTASTSGAAGRTEALIAIPAESSLAGDFALSPDGRRLVLQLINRASGDAVLAIRELATSAFNTLAHTDGAEKPFWSPDGSRIAFFADFKLKIIDLQGGPAQVICDAPTPRGGAWGDGDTIVFAGSFRTPLERVTAKPGSKPTPVSRLDEARNEKSHRWPAFLPGGTHVVFVAQTSEGGARDDSSTIEALEIATGKRTELVRANSSPLFVPGYLFFWRDGALRAQAFDSDRLTVSGEVLTIAKGVSLDTNERAAASVSASGALVYQTSSTANLSNLLLVDRSGKTIKTLAESILVEGGIAVSHDGKRVAVALTKAGAKNTDIWVYDLATGASTPLTFDEGGESIPLWSPNDGQVIYTNDRKNDGIVYSRFADARGDPEVVAENPSGYYPWGWSRAGWLILGVQTDNTGLDLVQYDPKTKKTTPIVATQAQEISGALSWDDRLFAYVSLETGRPEVYLRSLEGNPNRRMISNGGGVGPAWRRDGRELYFVSTQGQVMAAVVDSNASGVPSTPKELFRGNFEQEDQGYLMAPLPDGQQFVISVLKATEIPILTLVTNWRGQ